MSHLISNPSTIIGDILLSRTHGDQPGFSLCGRLKVWKFIELRHPHAAKQERQDWTPKSEVGRQILRNLPISQTPSRA